MPNTEIHAGVVGAAGEFVTRNCRISVHLIQLVLHGEVDRGAGDEAGEISEVAGALAIIMLVEELAVLEEVVADLGIVYVLITAAVIQRPAAGVVQDGISSYWRRRSIRVLILVRIFVPEPEYRSSILDARRLVVVVARVGLIHGGVGFPDDGVGVEEGLIVAIALIILIAILLHCPGQAVLGVPISILIGHIPIRVNFPVGRPSVIIYGYFLLAGLIGAGGAHLLGVAHPFQGVALVHLRVGELLGDAVHRAGGNTAEQQAIAVLQLELGCIFRDILVVQILIFTEQVLGEQIRRRPWG